MKSLAILFTVIYTKPNFYQGLMMRKINIYLTIPFTNTTILFSIPIYPVGYDKKRAKSINDKKESENE